MSQAIAKTEPIKALALDSLEGIMTLGQTLARSGYFNDATEAAQAVGKILAGKELGFGPIASMTGIFIYNGKVTMSANLIAAAIKRSINYDYRVLRLADEICEIQFFEDGKECGVSSFTLDDAKTAGLTTGKNAHSWKNYRRNMLFARAITNGAKWYCPDLSGGPIYTPDELDVKIEGESGQPMEPPVIARAASAKASPVPAPSTAFQGPEKAIVTNVGPPIEPVTATVSVVKDESPAAVAEKLTAAELEKAAEASNPFEEDAGPYLGDTVAKVTKAQLITLASLWDKLERRDVDEQTLRDTLYAKVGKRSRAELTAEEADQAIEAYAAALNHLIASAKARGENGGNGEKEGK